MNEQIMEKAGFGDELERIKKGNCPFCNEPITPFRDALSRKEFSISGLCQKCQDSVFGSDDDQE